MHRDVHHAMPRRLVEHVVRKGTPVLQIGLAIAIEIDGSGDLRFLGVALDGGGAGVRKCSPTLGRSGFAATRYYRRAVAAISTGFPSRL